MPFPEVFWESEFPVYMWESELPMCSECRNPSSKNQCRNTSSYLLGFSYTLTADSRFHWRSWGNFQKHTFVAPRTPLPWFCDFFISLVRANLEVPRGYIWVLGRFGDGMIDSPNPLPPGSRRGGVSISWITWFIYNIILTFNIENLSLPTHVCYQGGGWWVYHTILPSPNLPSTHM